MNAKEKILELFKELEEQVPVSVIAQKLEITEKTTNKHLKTLLGEGLIAKDEEAEPVLYGMPQDIESLDEESEDDEDIDLDALLDGDDEPLTKEEESEFDDLESDEDFGPTVELMGPERFSISEVAQDLGTTASQIKDLCKLKKIFIHPHGITAKEIEEIDFRETIASDRDLPDKL